MGIQGKAITFGRSLVFHTESLFVVGVVGDGVDEGVGGSQGERSCCQSRVSQDTL